MSHASPKILKEKWGWHRQNHREHQEKDFLTKTELSTWGRLQTLQTVGKTSKLTKKSERRGITFSSSFFRNGPEMLEIVNPHRSQASSWMVISPTLDSKLFANVSKKIRFSAMHPFKNYPWTKHHIRKGFLIKKRIARMDCASLQISDVINDHGYFWTLYGNR